jgi:hypothetical protein
VQRVSQGYRRGRQTIILKRNMGELGGSSYVICEGHVLTLRVSEHFEDNSNGLRQAVVAALVELHLSTMQTAEIAANQPSSALARSCVTEIT